MDKSYQEALKKIKKARKTNATTLNLTGSDLTVLPPEIQHLTNLQTLYASNTQLSALPPEIQHLTNLKVLEVSNTQLSALPPQIQHLTKLERLYVSNTQVSALPPEIQHLTNLKTLDVHHTQLSALPPEIQHLTNLTQLDVSNTQLSALPPEIQLLTKLQKLYIYNTQLSALPPEIQHLTNLQELYVHNSQLSALPPEIQHLTNLEILYVSNTQLSALPLEIQHLTKLKELNVDNTPLSALPPEIQHLTQLKELDVRGCPIKGLPDEVKADYRNPQRIITYLKVNVWVKQSEVQPLNEAKVLFVGEPAAGKTSVIKRLLGKPFVIGQPQTPGINVEIDPLTFELDGANIRLNLWDFGGQVIYQSTHQFFLSKRSLYVLVLNPRDDRDETVHKWLGLIKEYGAGSPAVIVCNQCDKGSIDLDTPALQEDYPFLSGIVHAFSCGSKEHQDKVIGMEDLQAALQAALKGLDGIHEPTNKKWFAVKNQLEEMKKSGTDYISRDEYNEICDGQSISEDERQSALLDRLDCLGTMLYFEDKYTNKQLYHYVLNPVWVTKNVYAVLDDKQVKAKYGLVTKEDIERILHQSGCKEYMPQFIVDLMEIFELCFSYKGENQYIIPQLLENKSPEEIEDFREGLHFELHCGEALLISMISRFILRMFPNIEDEHYWRTGLILAGEGCRALVRSHSYEKKIRISVLGENELNRKVLLENIRYEFFRIRSKYPHLHFREMAHIPEYDEFVLYEELLDYKNEGIETYRLSQARQTIHVQDTLNSVDPFYRTLEQYDQWKAGKAVITPAINPYLKRNIDMSELITSLRDTSEYFNRENNLLNTDEYYNLFNQYTRTLIDSLDNNKLNAKEIRDIINQSYIYAYKNENKLAFNQWAIDHPNIYDLIIKTGNNDLMNLFYALINKYHSANNESSIIIKEYL